tara:strand:- start:1812 stop:2375 length:564 start_codon:yes stop_codon:yes gene_type:complete
VLKNIVVRILLKCRKIKYDLYSTNNPVNGKQIPHQPVVLRGKGEISFGYQVNFGVINSPFFYNTYAYLEARNQNSILKFGNNIHINNGFSAVSEKSITIKDNVLIGYNCSIIDSSFHNIEINKRNETDSNPQKVIIEKNVFIGNNVTILKGVTIGENSVIANGSIVTKSFTKGVVIAGIPAVIIKKI